MEPFKNKLNTKVASQIAAAIAKVDPSFNHIAFNKNLTRDLELLELKERVQYLSDKIYQHLNKDITKSIPILVKALKKDQKNLKGFAVWPFTHYVATYGLDHFEISFDALKEMTKIFTSEFAVRAFFEKDSKRTLVEFKKWLNDENEHVRRLVSEGSRPLLPWGQKLHEFVSDPLLTWEFLDYLKNDSSEYVRKSVANHLNDHSKNHPEFVLKKLSDWNKDYSKDLQVQWIIKHAMRTLVKKGNSEALKLMGIKKCKIKLTKCLIEPKKIKLGESFKIDMVLVNLESKKINIIIDHEISLLKANGTYTQKVFKGKKIILLPKQKLSIDFKISFKKVTTRVYHPGKHFYAAKINGETQKPIEFRLTLV